MGALTTMQDDEMPELEGDATVKPSGTDAAVIDAAKAEDPKA